MRRATDRDEHARGGALRRALLAVAALLALAFLAAGCGGTSTVRERDLLVSGAERTIQATAPPDPAGAAVGRGPVRIQVVTHGQASSVFWAVVRNGLQAAARQVDAQVTYRSPDVFSVARMRALIDEAVAAKPDGLVVSLPSPALAGAVKRAERAGIPVVSINSGDNLYRSLGTLAHVSQDEGRAGFEAGQRLAAAGVHHAVCLNLEKGNAALDLRCSEFSRALRRHGATSRDLALNLDDAAATERLLTGVFRSHAVDGALALSSSGGEAALEALRNVRRVGKVKLATFDLSPKVLDAVRTGEMLFTIDQQPYLQGYLPIVFLANYARYGLIPSEGRLVPTGPHFVTKANAAQAEQLSRRIR
jgi:simple sugar transport system substrate-binding protein